jgi:hypothetical protein
VFLSPVLQMMTNSKLLSITAETLERSKLLLALFSYKSWESHVEEEAEEAARVCRISYMLPRVQYLASMITDCRKIFGGCFVCLQLCTGGV